MSVFPITDGLLKEVSERCCLIDVSMCGMFKRPRNQEKQLQKSQEFQVKWHWYLSGRSKNRYK